jgi:transcriptional regulator with XRE-family HTH domain
MEIQELIGARIKELRVAKNLTQEAVAWRSEVDRTFMNHVENGKRNVSIQSLEKIIIHGLESSFKEFFSPEVFAEKGGVEA